MKWTLPLILTLVSLGTANAQTKIGNVTLSKPSTPAPTRAAPAATSAVNSTTNVPAGWYEVKGRISAATPVSLSAGSNVTVLMENQTTRGQFVRIQFKTARLSTPYQIIFSPGRLNSNHQYTVRATITDASGKTIYQSSAVKVPNASRSVVDLSVR